jgi:PhnB protein
MTSEPGKTAHPRLARPVPEGYTAVTPFIISRDSDRLLRFVEEAFGGKEIARVVGEDGAIGHAEARIGDAIIMMFDAKKDWPDTPAFLRLYVEDCDAVYRQALAAGATSVTEMTTMFWGDRVGRVRDPLGNLWWIQTRLEDLSAAEIERRSTQKEYIDAMNYVQGARFFAPKK